MVYALSVAPCTSKPRCEQDAPSNGGQRLCLNAGFPRRRGLARLSGPTTQISMTERTKIIVAIGLFLLFAVPLFIVEWRKLKRREAAATPPPLPITKPSHQTTPMDDNTFWSIIDSAVSPDKAESDYNYDKLENRLRQMGAEEILGFGAAMQRAVNHAYDWRLWGAAYLINGGCSDDGFEYFRGWLIAQGSAIYRQALANPDSLADYIKSYKGSSPIEDEDLLAVPWMIFEEKTGSGDGYETGVEFAPEPNGENWDFDDEEQMKSRLPNLAALDPYERIDDEEDDD
jgi:Protein of unknown function (DUF4240)